MIRSLLEYHRYLAIFSSSSLSYFSLSLFYFSSSSFSSSLSYFSSKSFNIPNFEQACFLRF